MIFEHGGRRGSRWHSIRSIAGKLGCLPEPLRSWVKQVEVDTGCKDGVSIDERARVKGLERGVFELRRVHEIPARRPRISHRRSSTADQKDGRVHRLARSDLSGPAHLQVAAGRPVGRLRVQGAWARFGAATAAAAARYGATRGH